MHVAALCRGRPCFINYSCLVYCTLEFGPKNLFHRTLRLSLEHLNAIMGLPIHLIRRAETGDTPRPRINVSELESRELNITKRSDAIKLRNEQWEKEFLDKLKKQLEPIRELQISEHFKDADKNDTQDIESEDSKGDKDSADNEEEDHKREERKQIIYEKQQRKQKAPKQLMKLIMLFQLFVLFCFVCKGISGLSERP